MSNPGPSHMIAARLILKYLTGTTELGITYHYYQAQPTSKANLCLGQLCARDGSGQVQTQMVTGRGFLSLMERLPGSAMAEGGVGFRAAAYYSRALHWHSEAQHRATA
eukprot:653345-Rhodomonas_salina.1